MQIQFFVFVHAWPVNKQGDPRLPGPTSVQGISGGTRTRDRRIPADFRAGSLSATCLHAFWKFGYALVSVVANDLNINRAPTPETNQAPKGSGSLRAQI
ncbi:hypothetical protein PoB_000683600 [Plakobranchus ocellatus]|uniref:Uncharacterized protein n=1 Tax=Plakobranchus ocellatus TaxID=259542 RepID=A0AAV3XZF2_9GAST|nr:hypothetical protein PoB_000683600 [Plakobranchus ocellatus]